MDNPTPTSDSNTTDSNTPDSNVLQRKAQTASQPGIGRLIATGVAAAAIGALATFGIMAAAGPDHGDKGHRPQSAQHRGERPEMGPGGQRHQGPGDASQPKSGGGDGSRTQGDRLPGAQTPDADPEQQGPSGVPSRRS